MQTSQHSSKELHSPAHDSYQSHVTQAVELGLDGLKARYGEANVLTGMAALGILGPELEEPSSESIRETLPPGVPDLVVEKKVLLAQQKRGNLLRELAQKMSYVKPHEAKSFLTIPCGETPAWDELRSTLQGIDVTVGESAFYRTQCEKNAKSKERFQTDSKRKFHGFVEDLMLEKKRKDEGAAKQKASVQRLKNFKIDQDKMFGDRAALVQKKMDKIKSQNEKEKVEMLTRSDESDAKLAEKFARSDRARQVVVDKMQARADEATKHFEGVQDEVESMRKRFVKKMTHKAKVENRKQQDYLQGQEEMRRQLILDGERRAEEFREFIKRKDKYQAQQQTNRETKFLGELDKLNDIRDKGRTFMATRSKSCHELSAKRNDMWTKRSAQCNEERKEFNARVTGMHDKQSQQVADAKQRMFVSDVEERKARQDLWGSLQRSNTQRNQRSLQSHTNSTLVKVSMRNKASQNLEDQKNEITRQRQSMVRELGVKATETREVFESIKAETDPRKINAKLSKLGFGGLVDRPPVENEA